MAYGIGSHNYLGAAISGMMVPFFIYADRRFARQDVEWEKYQRIKTSLLATSETMIVLQECEAGATILAGMQVSD